MGFNHNKTEENAPSALACEQIIENGRQSSDSANDHQLSLPTQFPQTVHDCDTVQNENSKNAMNRKALDIPLSIFGECYSVPTFLHASPLYEGVPATDAIVESSVKTSPLDAEAPDNVKSDTVCQDTTKVNNESNNEQIGEPEKSSDINANHIEEEDSPENALKGCSFLDGIEFIEFLGKGSFGNVSLIEKKIGNEALFYALKVIPKNIIEKNEKYKEHFRCERIAMELIRGAKFLPTLYYAFQSYDHLYLVMDFACGGQLLNQFIGKNILFENHMRFYLAELLVAVDFLHKRGIIHRDIKPENVLLDQLGHIMLIDFGLCRLTANPPESGIVGTPPYIAPEILKRKPHDRMVDFWSLGVLGYEMVAGEPPFSLELTDEKLRQAVLEREPVFSAKLFHKPAKALLTGLMAKNPKERLGHNTKGNPDGMKAIMAHKFFKCINWTQAASGKLKPPSVPEKFRVVSKQPFTLPADTGYKLHFKNYSYNWTHSASRVPNS